MVVILPRWGAAVLRPYRRLLNQPGLGLFVGEGAGGVDGDAAVDEEGLAGYVAGGFGGEEDDGAVEVVSLAGAFYGDAVSDVGDPFGVVVHDFVLVGAEPAGG